MLVKKSFERGEQSGVATGNGKLTFGGVRLNVYSYFIDGVLIDTGAHSLRKPFLHYFAELPIERVMITHYHEDHSGLAAALQQQGLPIYMNESSLDIGAKKGDYLLYRKIFWGKRHAFQAQPTPPTFTGAKQQWRAIATPGHAFDHLAYLNESTGQLFTGDLYCGEKTKVMLREESMPTVITSLERVLNYDFGEMFCDHAGYIADGRTALTRKLNYLQELQHSILTKHQQGLNASEITAELFPRSYPIVTLSHGEWDALHIVTSTIADS
ncbi:beta-lactamase [Lysinibacillus sp. BF-4]|uniref:MBL fold metallo-hydrolase n=1 Tax=Lysinibacillus sp. BF-4 TaxID=1473546 RepID=UPI0005056B7D|nr:MBL fold metallo-hydrolase [Lysinibacillus sp. BF-4]KFL42550.1 beta-lactamase [Lysinibacillus sp. BF-4]